MKRSLPSLCLAVSIRPLQPFSRFRNWELITVAESGGTSLKATGATRDPGCSRVRSLTPSVLRGKLAGLEEK